MSIEFPQPRVAALHELAARLIDGRKVGGELKVLARELLRGFYDVCTLWGLDRVLAQLDASEPLALEERESLFDALVAQLDAAKLDGGGPRNAKPGLVADCVVSALGLTLVEEPAHTTTLGGDVRAAVVAAITAVVQAELAVPQIREVIITEARARCDESFYAAFTKVTAQLDDRGLHLIEAAEDPDRCHAGGPARPRRGAHRDHGAHRRSRD